MRDRKLEQGYDPDTPSCRTCLYWVREPRNRFIKTIVKTRKGKTREVLVRARKSSSNPTVDKCTFGNFENHPHGLCNEWRTKDGQRLEV